MAIVLTRKGIIGGGAFMTWNVEIAIVDLEGDWINLTFIKPPYFNCFFFRLAGSLLPRRG